MPNVNVRDGGVWKAAKEIFVRDAGTWKTVREVWIKDAGVWKQAFPESSGTQTYTTPGTYNWTVPNGIYSITVNTVVAGGGGSGGGGWTNCVGSNGDAYTGGAGGSGGFRTSQTLTVTPGESLTVVVGAGGTAGLYRYTAGGQGGSSSVTAASGSVSATGGFGGQPGPLCGDGSGGGGGSPGGTSGGNWTVCGGTSLGGTNGTGYGSGANATSCGSTNGNAGGAGYVSFSWS